MIAVCNLLFKVYVWVANTVSELLSVTGVHSDGESAFIARGIMRFLPGPLYRVVCCQLGLREAGCLPREGEIRGGGDITLALHPEPKSNLLHLWGCKMDGSRESALVIVCMR